jgi:hypothetical protein
MRFSSIATSIREALQHRQGQGEVIFRGRTTNATATELFIDGQPSRRMVPAKDSTTLIKIIGVAHYSNGTSLHSDSVAMFRTTAAGVITQVDLDGTTAAAQGIELAATVAAPSGAVVPKLNTFTLGGANGYTFTIVPATATADAYVSLSVTGVASVTIDWEIMVRFIEAGPRG